MQERFVNLGGLAVIRPGKLKGLEPFKLRNVRHYGQTVARICLSVNFELLNPEAKGAIRFSSVPHESAPVHA